MSPFFPERPKHESIRTSICKEQCADDNPFVADKTLWHGYDAQKLSANHSWTEILFLLAQGELPSAEQNQVLNRVMVFLANPGPRDAAVRAAMNCGVGKTPLATVLTTGLTVRGGMAEGSMHIELAMRFLNGEMLQTDVSTKHSSEYVQQLISDYREYWRQHSEEGVVPLPKNIPGFGLYYGQQDVRALKLLEILANVDGDHLYLARKIEQSLSDEREPLFLTLPGVVAAILADLGFSPEHGAGVYLIAAAPGIFAHGVEQFPRNWNEYPFWADPSYYNYEGPEPSKKVGAD